MSHCQDGWRDRVRRNWLDLGIAWTAEERIGATTRWFIEAIDADLIPIHGASTGDVIETLLKESIEDFVPRDCLIATSTNDGAGDERKAAFQLVQDGNDIWCAAHRVQLVIDDCLDPKRANPPADCQPIRDVLAKAHSLVVFINGHRAALQLFKELTSRKRAGEEGAKAWQQLVLDNDTRWDTDLMLLERVVYFDTEILQLYQDAEIGLPRDCILERAEFDLALGVTLVLNPFRKFTKWVQNRNKVTLAYVPGKLDNILRDIAPGRFDAQLAGCDPSVFGHVLAFQERLASSLRTRFESVFTGSSLALAARYLLPGENLFNFQHFQVAPNLLEQVRFILFLLIAVRCAKTFSTTTRHSCRPRRRRSNAQVIEVLLTPFSPSLVPSSTLRP